MNRTLSLIGIVLVVGWIVFRVVMFVVRRRRRVRPPVPQAPVTCPKCGSRHLDEMSDAESGYCLSCKHVWGVDPPQ